MDRAPEHADLMAPLFSAGSSHTVLPTQLNVCIAGSLASQIFEDRWFASLCFPILQSFPIWPEFLTLSIQSDIQCPGALPKLTHLSEKWQYINSVCSL